MSYPVLPPPPQQIEIHRYNVQLTDGTVAHVAAEWHDEAVAKAIAIHGAHNIKGKNVAAAHATSTLRVEMDYPHWLAANNRATYHKD